MSSKSVARCALIPVADLYDKLDLDAQKGKYLRSAFDARNLYKSKYESMKPLSC